MLLKKGRLRHWQTLQQQEVKQRNKQIRTIHFVQLSCTFYPASTKRFPHGDVLVSKPHGHRRSCRLPRKATAGSLWIASQSKRLLHCAVCQPRAIQIVYIDVTSSFVDTSMDCSIRKNFLLRICRARSCLHGSTSCTSVKCTVQNKMKCSKRSLNIVRNSQKNSKYCIGRAKPVVESDNSSNHFHIQKIRKFWNNFKETENQK